MARPKKESTPLNINLDKEINKKLSLFCKSTGFTKTVVVEKSLNKFIEEYYKTHPDEK